MAVDLLLSKKYCNFATMIELDRHIEILLLSNDCVIVPELGGFMAHHVDARFEEGENTFLPPLRTLGFNPQLKMNDSLLAQSYSEAYDISYPEAMRRIESEVSELRQHLDNEGRYEMNDIGVFSMNDEGRIEFEPCEAGILTPGFYGLSSFDMKPMFKAEKPVEVKPEKQTAKHRRRLRKPMAAKGGEQAIVIKMTWLRNAAAVAAAVLAFLLLAPPIDNGNSQSIAINTAEIPLLPKESKSVPTVVPVAKPTVKAEPAPAPKPVKVEPAVKAEPAPATVKETVETVSEPKTGYYIVLASQVNKKNADEFIQRLRKRGLTDARVYIYNNIRRVVCGYFTNESQAYAHLKKIHEVEDCSEAWVYKIKQ